MSIAGSSRVESDYAGDDRYCDLLIPGIEPVVRVAETEAVLAFHHTRPSYPVHIVVVPKQHVASLAALCIST